MHCIFGSDERLQHIGSESAEKKSDYVYYDHDSRREFDLKSLLHADDEGHCHCKYGEEEFVVDAGQSADQCDTGMQEGEDMYDSGCFQFMSHAVSVSNFHEGNNFEPIKQSFMTIHPHFFTIRPLLLPVRRKIYARVGINVYFRRLIYR